MRVYKKADKIIHISLASALEACENFKLRSKKNPWKGHPQPLDKNWEKPRSVLNLVTKRKFLTFGKIRTRLFSLSRTHCTDSAIYRSECFQASKRRIKQTRVTGSLNLPLHLIDRE